MSDSIILTVGPEEADNPAFGHILLSFRTRMNLTRSEAASRIGVTSEYVRMIEKGERSPALGMALKILDAYEVPWTLDESQVYFENVSAEFSGRIKEARGHFSDLNRNELIGQMVKFLVDADDDALKRIHSRYIKEKDVS
jgi:transcriptional regulator with XRE-family HTH domain